MNLQKPEVIYWKDPETGLLHEWIDAAPGTVTPFSIPVFVNPKQYAASKLVAVKR